VTAKPDHSWRQNLKRRLLVAAVIGVAWSIAIEARLVYLQVLQYEFLTKEAKKQQLDTITLEAKRGDIVDRDGRLLAYNVDSDSVYAVPTDIKDGTATVAELCKALEGCTSQERDQYVSRINRRDEEGRRKQFVWLRRKISTEEAARVKQLNLKGIYLRTETRRWYPQRELAAHLLGYVGDENIGRAGLEEQYQRLVGGEQGKLLMQVDARQRPFSRVEQSPIPGASLELTIDSEIQHIVERELAAGVEWSGALAGSAIVMDPMTGEILALANYPTFNPNAFKAFADEVKTNRAIQNVYEPGSTFKIVTAGAALEERLSRPTDLINTSPGVIRFGARVIDEAKGHNYGTLTFEDVIVKSSNVGAIRIGLKLGRDRLSEYVSRFGFGARTTHSPLYGFKGESKGIVWKAADLTDSAVASISMGYQVSVTPLQMAAAVSSVANGGELLEPRVVRAIVRDRVRTPNPRTVVRRVVSTEVASELTSIMEGVVDRGTAKSAQIDGYTIAGKTGTAAKAIKGGYSSSDYNVSFVGFLPSRNPVFTILVVIDSPHKVSPYGGTVAAPVFQKIASAALRLRGVPPSLNRPAPLIIARRDDVHQQTVSAPADAVVTLAQAASDSPAVLPDLVGMNVRDAALALVRLGLTPRVSGSGYVVASQRPAPGSPLDDIDTAALWLERRPRLELPARDVQPAALAGVLPPRGTP
jgi:cell division protein FtsI (penicillin-binding protein 3)